MTLNDLTPAATHVIRFKDTGDFICLMAVPTQELGIASKFTSPEAAAEAMSRLPGAQSLEIVKYNADLSDEMADAAINQVLCGQFVEIDEFVEQNRDALRQLCRLVTFTYIASAIPTRCGG